MEAKHVECPKEGYLIVILDWFIVSISPISLIYILVSWWDLDYNQCYWECVSPFNIRSKGKPCPWYIVLFCHNQHLGDCGADIWIPRHRYTSYPKGLRWFSMDQALRIRFSVPIQTALESEWLWTRSDVAHFPCSKISRPMGYGYAGSGRGRGNVYFTTRPSTYTWGIREMKLLEGWYTKGCGDLQFMNGPYFGVQQCQGYAYRTCGQFSRRSGVAI